MSDKIQKEIELYDRWSKTCRLGRFDILNVEAFEAKIASLNRKAVKLGVPPVEVKKLGTHYRKMRVGYDELMERPIEARVQVTRILLFGQVVKIAGWQFAAVLEHLVEGNVVRSVPGGPEIPVKYRKVKAKCEHCKTTRARKDTYLLYKDGKFKQVGSNCLGDFTGIHNPATFAHRAEMLLEAREYGEAAEREPARQHQHQFSTLGFLKYAAMAIRLHGWVAKSDEDCRAGLKASTYDIAIDLMMKNLDKPTDVDAELATKVIAWGQKLYKESGKRHLSEYEFNLTMLLSQPWISPREFGIVASGVAAYNRAMEKALVDSMPKRESDYLGKVGDKMEFERLSCLSSTEMEGRYGFTTIIRMVDDNGNVVVWFASGRINVNRGDVVKGKAAIKTHEEYRGVKQTVITRFKFDWLVSASR